MSLITPLPLPALLAVTNLHASSQYWPPGGVGEAVKDTVGEIIEVVVGDGVGAVVAETVDEAIMDMIVVTVGVKVPVAPTAGSPFGFTPA